MAMPAIDVARLTTDERLDLIGRLWDSIGPAASLLPLTAAQREELDERLDDLEREGPTGTAWDEAVRRIGSSRRSRSFFDHQPRPSRNPRVWRRRLELGDGNKPLQR
jgi:putative addiction module component (TIGR02574 family)